MAIYSSAGREYEAEQLMVDDPPGRRGDWVVTRGSGRRYFSNKAFRRVFHPVTHEAADSLHDLRPGEE